MNLDELEPRLEALHAASFAWTLACCDGRREEAEEVLQTTYLEILEGRARFNGGSSLKTWLFAVIRRTAANRRRRRWYRKLLLARWAEGRHDDRAAGPTPEDELRQAQQRRRIRRGLEAVSKRQRQVLELVFYHDLSVRQAAGVLGVGLGTARVHYERGKKALSRALREEDGNGTRDGSAA